MPGPFVSQLPNNLQMQLPESRRLQEIHDLCLEFIHIFYYIIQRLYTTYHENVTDEEAG